MAIDTHPHRDTDYESLAPPPATKNRLMLVGMVVFGALLVGIVIFALVTLLGPDRYDKVTIQELVDRPVPSVIVAPLNDSAPTTPTR